MALRLEQANSERLFRTSGPSMTAFTAMGWARVEPGTTGTQGLFSMNGYNVCACWRDSPGDALFTFDGVVYNPSTLPSMPSTGEWWHWYVKCSGTGSGQIEYGWRRPSDAAYVATSGATLNSGITVTDMSFGLGDDDYFNGQMAAIKVWDAALSAAEIEQEMWLIRPIRTANLHLWTPMVDTTLATNYTDYSGNGRTLTAANTPSVEDGPPITWGANSGVVAYTVASGSGTLTATLGGFSLSSAGVLTLAGSATPTLGAFTLASAGALAIVGTTSPTLGAVTLSATGAQTNVGTLSASLGAITLASAGALAVRGTLTATLDAFALSAAGTNTSPILGTLDATLGAFTLVATGSFQIIAPPLSGASLTAPPLSGLIIIAPPL